MGSTRSLPNRARPAIRMKIVCKAFACDVAGPPSQTSSNRTRIAMFSAATKPSTHLIAPTSARNPA